MAIIQNTSGNNLLNQVFPVYGEVVRNIQPIWQESMKMFVMTEYESKNGHRYISGLRFSNRLAVVIKYSLWNTWTYLDELEVYKFNGDERQLLDKRKYDKVYYKEDLIRDEVVSMVGDSIVSATIMNNCTVNHDDINEQVKILVKETERSFNKGEYPPMTSSLRKLIESKQSQTIHM